MPEPMPIGYDIDLLCQAVDVAARLEQVSVIPFQRKLRVGFVKAERLVLLLIDYGIIGPRDARGRAPVLISGEDRDATVARLREIASEEPAGA